MSRENSIINLTLAHRIQAEWVDEILPLLAPCKSELELLEQVENGVFIPWAHPFNLEAISSVKGLREAEFKFNERFWFLNLKFCFTSVTSVFSLGGVALLR